ncbi:hypothetical protein MRB53_013258 [Persea americana]|uniref:Uncharacterized protein n=1 Tax=Persea americana TaxID=3435 RepID=A0ACC2K7X4_PERAE|nr:hypothetical protein MRB53_013258 [Persea americana]
MRTMGMVWRDGFRVLISVVEWGCAEGVVFGLLVFSGGAGRVCDEDRWVMQGGCAAVKGEWFGIGRDGFLTKGKIDEGYAPIGDWRRIRATWIFVLIPIDAT